VKLCAESWSRSRSLLKSLAPRNGGFFALYYPISPDFAQFSASIKPQVTNTNFHWYGKTVSPKSNADADTFKKALRLRMVVARPVLPNFALFYLFLPNSALCNTSQKKRSLLIGWHLAVKDCGQSLFGSAHARWILLEMTGYDEITIFFSQPSILIYRYQTNPPKKMLYSKVMLSKFCLKTIHTSEFSGR
jgi:hypothetical protein